MVPEFKRILIYRLGGLGDLTVALPVINALAARFPQSQRALLTNPPISLRSAGNRELFEGSGLFQDYFFYERGLRDIGKVSDVWRAIRQWQPDLICNLQPRLGVIDAVRDRLFFQTLRPRAIWGVPIGQGRLFQKRAGMDLWESEAARLARFVSQYLAVDIEASDAWDLHFGKDEPASVAAKPSAQLMAPYIAFNLGGKSDVQDWGDDRWRQVLTSLSGQFPDLGLVMVGAVSERGRSDFAAGLWRGPRWNLCGSLTVRETATVLGGSVAFMGHDSGPMHLAEAMGTPVIAVFSARAYPGVWFPHGAGNHAFYHQTPCFGCGLDICIEHGKKCILAIEPGSVSDTAILFIEERLKI